MIIECNVCEKKFNVPDSAIMSSGRLVQCSSCGNKWTQYPTKTKKNINPAFLPKKTQAKKPSKKKGGAEPYSKEYMQQKWGTSFQKNIPTKNLIIKISKEK